jgi:pimeloyl-ACP methyl ester carboxylesterase
VKVKARGPVWLVYAKMLLRLQQDYEVHTFPFDWRLATWDVVPRLRAFIDEKLAASPFRKVTLVGHSLGGVLALDYLIGEQTRAHAERHVQRLIALGSPFRGALPAAYILARGDEPKLKLIKSMNAQNDPLRMLRSFPSMYEILPAPKDFYPDWNPTPDQNLWDASTWEHQGIPINREHLARALKHHEAFAKADPQVPVECVVGALYETPTGLVGDLIRGAIQKMWEGPAGGDGTVAIPSAMLKNRPAYYVHEIHVELVLEKSVIDGVADWVEGGKPDRLVQRIEDVIMIDGPMRGMAAAPEMEAQAVAVNASQIAEKAMADQPLDHEELEMLQTLI